MNNGDKEKINDEWKKVLIEVEKICETYNIELILATISSVSTVNNDHKNKYVKNSGYKYIDLALAVDSYSNAEWYEGMLEKGEKRVHPTVNGAIALYS